MPTRSSSLGNNVSTAVDREIGSQYDNVRIVAENIESVVTVADHIENVDTVATNIVDVHAVGGSIVDVRTVATNINSVIAVEQDIANINVVAANVDNIDMIVAEVIPNIDEIANASANAAIATTKANEAATSAANALVSEQNAKASELAAGVSEDNAAASETVAIAKAAEANASAIAAHNSELAAEALLDAFNDRYLGSFAVDPVTDNDGQPLLDGALYYNTVNNVLKVYDVSNVMWYTIPQVQLSTLLDVQLTSVTTGDVLTWNGSKWINTRDVILNSLQLRGGTGTQGTFSWNADEETVDLIQNGAVLQLGQEVQTHVRNATASTIGNGKVVMVTGTIGASGRITVGLYDGVSEVKYILGVCTEDIVAGDDGKVTHFGKVRGINTSAWNEGDLLYPTTNGNFTNVAPTSGVRLALAIVITKHAVNGTIMVRANGVNENAYEPKNANIQTHIASTSNPHSVTKAQVGLSNVDNTSDVNKPISTATQTALDLKAPLASPALTGTPTAPTATVGDSSTKLATTAFVNAEIANDTYLKGTLDTNTTIMSKAAFNALAAERRANRAGSGFDEWGKQHSSQGIINEGMTVFNPPSTSFPSTVLLGRTASSQTGISKTDMPYVSINGIVSKLEGISSSDSGWKNIITLPPAPTVLPYDATLTPEQIAMGVIKHADASNSGLIVNGKFTTDTSGWSGGGASSLSLSSNALRITNTTASYGYAYQAITTVAGKKYTVEFSMIIGTSSSNPIFRVGTTAGGSDILNNSISSSQRYQYDFIATSTTSYIGFWVGSNVSTQYTDFDNVAVFPSDAISRSDLVFLESWHEDVSEKDFVYPLGNVQYLGTTGDSGTPVAGAFAGSGTYSLFSNWQASGALVGKGYVWSGMSDAQKKAFVSNPENNCYLDGDKTIQVRYRTRVVAGIGDSWDVVDTQNTTTALRYSSSLYVEPQGKIVNPKQFNTANYYSNATAWTAINRVDGQWTATVGTSPSTTFGYEGKCFALPIALVHRRNQGAYHPVYNANGTRSYLQTGINGNVKWYEPLGIAFYTSISACFTFGNDATNTTSGSIATSNNFGRPDGLFYDQVHEGDITDLRMSSQKVEDYNRLIDREFNKLVAGTYRGSEGEWNTKISYGGNTDILYDYTTNLRVAFYGDFSSLSIGDTIYVAYWNGSVFTYDRVVLDTVTSTSCAGIAVNISTLLSGGSTPKDGIKFFYYSTKTTRTKSNTLTHTDIIGSPANYPTAWKQSGVSGVPLIVAEDGTNLLPNDVLTTFKLSKKANATPLQVLKSTDSGATWTALAVTTGYTFSATTNAITLVAAPAATDLIMVIYQTHTSMAVAGANAEVLAVGDVLATNYFSITYTAFSAILANDLLKKVVTGATGAVPLIAKERINPSVTATGLMDASFTNKPYHTTISLYNTNTPTVKTFPYLTRSNGKARLQLVFKEMKHNGTTWGDHDNTFSIVDNVSTTTDGNGATILIGQKYAELPYFIGAGE